MAVQNYRQGMKLYLADIVAKNHAYAKKGTDRLGQQLRILISFWYFRKENLDEVFAKHFTPPYPEVFADSGAFSAWSMGQPLDVGEYAEWLHRWKHLFAVYANLDVKGDIDGGLRNQQELERRGLRPLPVFHGGEPISVLQDLITEYPYIALGGLSGHTSSGSKEMWRFIIKCFQVAGDKTVYHGFGMTNWKLMKAFRWYSVDSSSWGSGFRYGTFNLFNPSKGNFIKVSLGDKKGATYAPLIRQYGYDWLDFADRSRNDREKICAISAASYMRAEAWLRSRHGEIYVPDSGKKPESTYDVA